MAITTGFDFAALRRTIEERDAEGQLALYADDAEIRLVDRDHPPSRPLVLRGREAIGAFLAEECSRDMTHRVEQSLVSGDNAAFTVACRYPDGKRVLCTAMLDLKDGRIARKVGVQAWDG